MRILSRQSSHYPDHAFFLFMLIMYSAIAAVIGAPYIATRRLWDERNGESSDTSGRVDESQKKPSNDSNDSKEEAKAGAQSVEHILRGESRELAKLRDAVR